MTSQLMHGPYGTMSCVLHICHYYFHYIHDIGIFYFHIFDSLSLILTTTYLDTSVFCEPDERVYIQSTNDSYCNKSVLWHITRLHDP